MKKKILGVLLLILCILNGCGTQENVEYKQKDLVEPDKILLDGDGGTKIITYENNPEKYTAIYDAINENWWKYVDTDEEIVSDDELIEVSNVEKLRTASDSRYMNDLSVMQSMTFVYEEQLMTWTRSAVQEFEVSELFFILPKDAEEGKNTKSFYQVRTKDEKVPFEGIFSYYYSDDFFNILSETGQTVSSVYNEEPTDIEIDHFSDITTDEMYDIFFNNTGWTRLEGEKVYWNPLLECVTINHTFSEKASEKQLEDARDYVKVLELYRNASWESETRALWNRIPWDADVIIQVYVEDELISQDIYENCENGLYYKETHYKK